MPPVAIADTDGPGLQCVLEQMEKGREGGREGGKMQTKNAETPKSLWVTWSTNRGWGEKKETEIGTKKGKVKTSFRLYVNAGRDGGMKKRW